MAPDHVVVDGSNLATEGRSQPSLAQLDEAVRAYAAEHPDDELIVVVDASFGYRIEESERAAFEAAYEAGELVSPPAGAIGRGDGFLLEIADRTGGIVLSNDSFQEFHGEYEWLFERGRLVGGKPVPGVGWIFMARTPVRGPRSRVAVSDAKKRKRAESAKVAADAIAAATADALEPTSGRRRRGRRRGRGGATAAPAEPVNEPFPFINFIAEHPLGSEVEGTVEGFTSHGAFVLAGGARCYAPVTGLGDPPPRSAKEVVHKGETRVFVVQALDPPRRGIELALPGVARVAGAPTEETVEAEITETAKAARKAPARKAATASAAGAAKKGAAAPAGKRAAAAAPAAAKKAATKTAAAKAAVGMEKTATKSAAATAPAKAAKKAAATGPAAPTTKSAAAGAGAAKKAATKTAAAKAAVGTEKTATKAAAKKAAANKAAVGKNAAAKKAPTKKAAAKKAAAKKVGGAKKVTPRSSVQKSR